MFIKIDLNNKTTVVQCTEYTFGFTDEDGGLHMTMYDRPTRSGTEQTISGEEYGDDNQSLSIYVMNDRGQTVETILSCK